MDDLIKKPGQLVSYTPKEIEELKACADPSSGPLYFMENFIYVQHPVDGRIKFNPYPFQRELIYNYHNFKSNICLVSRQNGKCLVGNEMINIRNKKTGEIKKVTFKEFKEIVKDGKTG